MQNARNSAGFTIVELLIAVTLGLLLTVGLINVFINSKQAYSVQDATSRMQENGRFAVEALSRAIHLADFWGSAAPDAVTVIGTPKYKGAGSCEDAWLINPADGVHGYEGIASVPEKLPSSTCIEDYIPRSDVIALRYADPDATVPTAKLTTDLSNGSYFVRVLTGKTARLFSGKSAADVAAAITAIPDDATSPGAVLNYRFKPELYYLAMFKPGPGAGFIDPVPTLYYRQAQSDGVQGTPLVDGVEMMNFEYGVDVNGDLATDRYVRAGDVDAMTGGWGKVLSVRVSLIVRGDVIDNFKDTKKYVMAGGTAADTFEPKDREQNFLRTQIVKEVQVRNRVRARS